MKSLLLSLISFACIVSNAQTLTFDYATKRWLNLHRGKYLVVKYGRQPVIDIVGLPQDFTTEVKEEQYDVVFEKAVADPSKGIVPTFKTTQTMKSAKADEIEYTITIKDAGGTDVHKVTGSARVYSRWKIDVSTGAIFNIGLANDKYYYEDAGSNQSIIKKDNDNTDFIPMPAVLTHFYKTNKSYVNWGGCFGLGLSDSGKTGWYFGASTLLGDRNRIGISAGMAWRNADRLKSRYTDLVNKQTPIDNANKVEEGDLVTASYQQGWFLSFTYNLSSSLEKK